MLANLSVRRINYSRQFSGRDCGGHSWTKGYYCSRHFGRQFSLSAAYTLQVSTSYTAADTALLWIVEDS